MVAAKWMVLAGVVLVAVPAQGNAWEVQKTEFEKIKEHEIQMLEKRLTCIKASSTRQELNHCRQMARKAQTQQPRTAN
ncbi:MAG: hypothetical protein HQL73_13910 [Magnetococcales bacterium]|nr:hypothetical protein [Magnetococcales bacterium]